MKKIPETVLLVWYEKQTLTLNTKKWKQRGGTSLAPKQLKCFWKLFYENLLVLASAFATKTVLLKKSA